MGALGFKRTLGTGSIPVFQGDGDDIQVYQGGFLLDMANLAVGQVIPAGTPLVLDEQARTAVALPVAVLYANAANNATTYQIQKNSRLQVGQNFAASVGGNAEPITGIDTSNAAYDVVTVGTTLGVALNAGQFLFASTAAGANAAALPACNGLLLDETTADANVSVSAVLRGTVYARRVPYSADLAALPGLRHIIYSQSF